MSKSSVYEPPPPTYRVFPLDFCNGKKIMSYCQSSWCTSMFRILDFCAYTCEYYCFSLSWLVMVDQDWTTWLLNQLSPLSCYCADHCQLWHTPSFIKWGCLLSHLRNETPSVIYVMVQKVFTFC
jgi:hypothetical protein